MVRICWREGLGASWGPPGGVWGASWGPPGGLKGPPGGLQVVSAWLWEAFRRLWKALRWLRDGHSLARWQIQKNIETHWVFNAFQGSEGLAGLRCGPSWAPWGPLGAPWGPLGGLFDLL